MTRSGVAQLEQGRNKPSWDTVLALCKALQVSCEAFTQEPTQRPQAGRGRPRKAAAGPARSPTSQEAPPAEPEVGADTRRKVAKPTGGTATRASRRPKAPGG